MTSPVPEPSAAVWQKQQHSHHELAYVDKGACLFVLVDKVFRLPAGSLCIISPGEYHYEVPEHSDANYRIIWLKTNISHIRIHATEYSGKRRHLQHVYQGINIWFGSNLETMLAAIAREAQTRDRFTDTLVTGYLLTLVSLIGRQLYGLTTREDIDDMRSSQFTNKVVSYIKTHYHEPGFTIKNLAGEMGFSTNYFISHFRMQTGYTPHQYLMKTRMEKARELLAAADFPIAGIAAEVGFTSPYHFSTTFKTCFGITPSDYRHESRAITPLNNLQRQHNTAAQGT